MQSIHGNKKKIGTFQPQKKSGFLVPFTIQAGAVYMIWNAAKFYI